jgi:predicted dehydrogenase
MVIRIAAIGVSHWHAINDAAYLHQLARMPNVSLVGLHDERPEVAAERSTAVGGVPCFSDYEDMLRITKPDFVLALGRHDTMARVAHHLIDCGLPFLMEKPMGRCADEVRTIAEKAAGTGTFAAVPMPFRYSPFMARARKMLAASAFGPLSHVYVRTNRFSSARYVAWDCPWMLDPALSGGGCLRNLGAHALDLFLHLVGEDAAVTGAQISARAHRQQVEDYASVLVRSASGVLGTLEVGNAYPRVTRDPKVDGPTRDELLDGADGEIKICGRDAMLMAKDGNLRIVTAAGEENTPGLPLRNPAYDLIPDVLAHWRRGQPPPVSVDDCYRAVRLIDEAYRMTAATGL